MGAEVIMIIETDLECDKCFDKIHKLLSKGKEKARCCCCICYAVFCRVSTCFTTKKQGKHVKKISTITCDKKKNTVTISGTFDPVKLERLLRCEAGEAIRSITIVKPAVEKEKEKKKKEEEEKKKKKAEEEKQKTAAEESPLTTTTLNVMQLTQICNLCYPWPCRDPSHLVGVLPPHHQYQQQPLPWAPAPAPPPHGWPPAMPTPVQMMQAPPMCVPGGPSSCRGCKGCRIVQEGKFSYEEYPQNSCAVM